MSIVGHREGRLIVVRLWVCVIIRKCARLFNYLTSNSLNNATSILATFFSPIASLFWPNAAFKLLDYKGEDGLIVDRIFNDLAIHQSSL